MHGGTISSGRSKTVAVAGRYWISWMKLVLVDDRARRDREIAPDLERRLVGHRDHALLDVGREVLQPLRQAFAAGFLQRA